MERKEIFEPIKTAHAVAEVIFFFEFSELLISSRKKMDDLKAGMVDLLPDAKEQKSVQISLGDDEAASVQHSADAIQFSKQSPAGELQWLARVVGPTLSVHCVDYSRWAPVKTQFLAILECALNSLGIKDGFSGVGLKVIDRFRYNESAGAYDLARLVDPESKYVSRHVFDSGHRWHFYSGWYERDAVDLEGVEVLSQLNLDSSFVAISDGVLQNFVTFDHTLALKNVEMGNGVLVALEGGSSAVDVISKVFDNLHEVNKSIIRDVLSKEVADRMNLKRQEA
ncbi:TIGR04255 family protein [Pseudomonas linyingensis]|uniref:TIGR04255 family protein n=1 Tax=Pseudomonas linyingensis TaxID=915471 RepID=A0A1H6ZUS5_9PSED|nr:TIGR04255 family protein [Pseudomonas linyingensis]SEJ57233.1 TIGR04255 family protein [Pseudomonas linyingensis]